MEEQIKKEEEFSLADIVGSLLSKIKLLILVLLAGCFLGGAFGFLKSYDVVYYGTNLTFFVTPKVDSSDEEKIHGSYGVTVMDTMIKFLSTDYAVKEYLLDMEYENLPQIPDPEADRATYSQQVLAYDNLVQQVKSFISFSYKADGSKEVTGSDPESKNFIYVNISVQEGGLFTKEFTGELLRQLQVKIPKIVSETMYKPEDTYDRTSCTLVTPLYPMVEWMNRTYALKETVKYGLIAGAGLFILACVAIILVEKLDQRIKDSEEIEKKLNIPVLGVIPSNFQASANEEKQGGKN